MKIGFDIASLNISMRTLNAGSLDNMKQLFSMLCDSGQELFVFYPADIDAKSANKCKKNFLKHCKRASIVPFRFAVIRINDLSGAAERNHIDILVTADEQCANQASLFTDTVYTGNMNAESVLEHITLIVQKNRQPVVPADASPNSIPTADRLWLKHYRTGDLKWNQGNMSPYERLIVSNQDWLDETAMEFFGKTYTYGDFFRRIDETADIMYADGIRKGMRVPLIVANTPESLIVLYALYKLKATVTPIFPLSTKEDMRCKLDKICRQNQVNGFQQTKLFLSDMVYARFSKIIPENVTVIALDITSSMPKPMKFAFRHLIAPKMGIKPVPFNDRVISFKKYTEHCAPHTELDISFDNSYAAVQLYTGGTVKPKGVRLSEGNIDAAAKQFYNDRFAFRRGDKIAAFMPLNHSFGLIIGTHVAFTLGVNLDIIMKINFKRLDKLFLKDKINLFGGIPNMFPAIRNNTHFKNADLSHVKYILSGGSLIDKTEKQRTTEFFQTHHSQAEVHDGYGQTESAGGIIYDGVPNIGVDVKIVEGGTDRELDYEQLGELCMTGAQIMLGYDDDALNAFVLKKHGDDRIWLHTGDNAVIHSDGKVEVIGRMDRMIKVNGEQVILDDIEELINALPFVEKSSVVKLSDKKRGFVPVAFIKLKPDEQWNAENQAVIEQLYNERLTAYSKPRKTSVIEEFPVTAVGKIDFRALEALAEKGEQL